MNEELSLFRDNVKRFIDTEIRPYYEQWERDEIFPREVWNKLGELDALVRKEARETELILKEQMLLTREEVDRSIGPQTWQRTDPRC